MNGKLQKTNEMLDFAAIIGVALVVVLIYRSSFGTMWELWQRSSHQHGILIFPIAAYLIWRISPRLSSLQSSWSFPGFIVLVAMSSLWLVGRLSGVQIVEHFSALALIPAAVLALFGTKIFDAAMFPLLLILLATPISDSFVPFLMTVTADLSTAMLTVTGYAVFRTGQHLSLPGGDFVIAKVCSGVRYLMAGTTIALLFSYLSFNSWVKRIVFVGATMVVLVLANGFRAFVVMAVGSSSNMRYMAGAEHVYFGWVLFGLVTFAAMWFGSHYIDQPGQTTANGESTLRRLPAIPGRWLIVVLGVLMLVFTFNPLGSESVEYGRGLIAILALVSLLFYAIATPKIGGMRPGGLSGKSAKLMARSLAPWVVAGSVLALAPYIGVSVLKSASSTVEYVDLHQIQSCSPRNQWSEVWTPQFRNPAVELGVTLTCGAIPTNVYVAAYAGSFQDHELISEANIAVPHKIRLNAEATVQEISIGGTTRSVRELVVRSPEYQGVIWSWYDIDGQVATTKIIAKYYQMLALVRGRPSGGQMVLVSTRFDSDVADARNRLRVALAKINLEADQTLVPGSL